jgi:hypothetical protein
LRWVEDIDLREERNAYTVLFLELLGSRTHVKVRRWENGITEINSKGMRWIKLLGIMFSGGILY